MLAALYAVAIIVLTVYGGNLLWMAVRYARGDSLRGGRVPEPDELPASPDAWPGVTIQLPLYNEPLVVERLIDACVRMRYPRGKLEIQVLDDSTDVTTERVASRVDYWRRREVDIVHIRRQHRAGYKAGALQNGLRLSRGEYVAVFDADFVPTPDFLLRILPAFTAPDVGMVQGRWGHLNQDASLLTRMQAMGLDAHFAVEQQVRAQESYFINFNGTAGVWRRACIEDGGGWEGDTLAEDLDLSYRAQMRGWRFRYLNDVEVPAELPSTMGALRAQQFRWAKGSVETARKLLGSLARSRVPFRAKLQGTLHMTAHVVFPFILLAAVVHAPLMLAASSGNGPGRAYFGWMTVGLVGFAGFALAQLLAQRDLYPDWARRVRLFPVFMAGSIGLSLNNSRAVAEALVGKASAFIRTPKLNQIAGRSRRAVPAVPADDLLGDGSRAATTVTATRPVPAIAWAETALFAYSLAGLVAIAFAGEWAAVPFQAVFAGAFGLVAVETWKDRRRSCD